MVSVPSAVGLISGPHSMEERVAALEERTAPRKKSLLDQAKEWGGILSLLVALGYTFPLGLWDRFFVSAQVREARNITEARGIILRSAELVSDFGQVTSSIHDPRLRNLVSRAFDTRLHILLASSEDLLSKYASRLSPQEILVAAYNYQSIGQIGEALDLYEVALKKAEGDNYLTSEILRLKGAALFIPAPTQNVAEARTAFQAAAVHADGARSLRGIGSKVSVLADWGNAELLAGDWQCGRSRIEEALGVLHRFGPQLGEDGTMIQLLQRQLAVSARRPDQPAQGCQLPNRAPPVDAETAS